MADTEKQEFLSPHQCFIVYDDLTKQIAISIRNRLSEKGVKCVIWNDKQFKDNEARLSNYNRLLIFNKKIADEYLSNYTILSRRITDYVIYKREGRVASICLIDEKVDYSELFKSVQTNIEQLRQGIESADLETKTKIQALAPNELANAIAAIQENDVRALPEQTRENAIKDNEEDSNSAITILKGLGVGALAIGLLPLSISLGTFLWFAKRDDAEKCKQLLLFDAVLKFEKDLLDDFVNAK